MVKKVFLNPKPAVGEVFMKHPLRKKKYSKTSKTYFLVLFDVLINACCGKLIFSHNIMKLSLAFWVLISSCFRSLINCIRITNQCLSYQRFNIMFCCLRFQGVYLCLFNVKCSSFLLLSFSRPHCEFAPSNQKFKGLSSKFSFPKNEFLSGLLVNIFVLDG